MPTPALDMRHLPPRPRWGKNERKLLCLLAIQQLPKPTINELHAYLHQIGREREFITRSALQKLVTRYRLGGLLKREKSEREFQTLTRTWRGIEYRYMITDRGIAKLAWLIEQKRHLFSPDEMEPKSEPSKPDLKDLLWALLLKQKIQK